MDFPVARSSGRRLLVSTQGVRGDCQPAIALCLALQKAGFVVCLSINADLVDFARSMGLDAVEGSLDVKQANRELPELRECMAKGKNLEFAKAMGKLAQDHFPTTLAQRIDIFNTFRPDVLVTTPINFFEDFAHASSFGIPVVLANFQISFPSKELTSQFQEPRWGPHNLLQTLFYYVFWKGQNDHKMGMMAERLPETRPFLLTTFEQFMYTVGHPYYPIVTGFSPSLKTAPTDWTEDMKQRTHVTGFWTLTKEEQQERLELGDKMFGGEEKDALETFLAQGSPPVYMGWGSMISVSSQYMTLLAIRALLKAGLRGIVLRGYADLDPGLLSGQPDCESLKAYAAKHVLFVKTAPHEWLFPQCSVIVHHGGAGTTAAALRSGVPTVVTPCAFDQFDHASMVRDRGVGVALRQFSKVTAAALANAMRQCTEDEAMQERCRVLAGRLASEDGVGHAVRAIDDFIADEVETGKWKANFVAKARVLKLMKSRRSPSCWAWIGRLCCSGSPNDYSSKAVVSDPSSDTKACEV